MCIEVSVRYLFDYVCSYLIYVRLVHRRPYAYAAKMHIYTVVTNSPSAEGFSDSHNKSKQ